MGTKAETPADADERWDAGPCEKDHDGYTIAHGWSCGDLPAMEFRYPCGCVKQWIKKAGAEATRSERVHDDAR